MFSSCGVSPENVDNSNNETYTVYLDKVKSEATCPDTIFIKKGEYLTLPNLENITEYNFKGWVTVDGEQPYYSGIFTLNHDLRLKAVWENAWSPIV